MGRIRSIGRFLLVFFIVLWAVSPMAILGPPDRIVAVILLPLILTLAFGLSVTVTRRNYSVEHLLVFAIIVSIGVFPFNYVRTSSLWPFTQLWLFDILVTSAALLVVYSITYVLVYRIGYDKIEGW